MAAIKEIIQNTIKQKVKEQIAKSQQPQEQKSIGGFLSNVAKDVTGFAKGIVGLGYKAVTHPVETVRTVASTGKELVKTLPEAAIGLGKQVAKTVTSPIKTTKEGIQAYQKIRDVPYGEQKKLFEDISRKMLEKDERGKKVLGALGAGLLGATVSEITHPAQFAYDQPFTFALDALSLGQATGANKAISAATKAAIESTPATAKVLTAMKEAFTPHGKLITAGYGDVAKDLMKTKSEIFKAQREIIDSTATKFNREFGLSQKEQREFFETIDSLRRVKRPIPKEPVKVPAITDVRKVDLGAQRDAIQTNLKSLDTQSFVTKGKADVDTFAEAKEIIQKIEKGTDSADDLKRGMEILKLQESKPLEVPVVKAMSQNPKIQKAIDWWLDEELPKLRQASGITEERAITNYLHHFFPDKFKKKETFLGTPLQYSKKGYLKQSKDVEGFTKDPVLSISAIESRVAVDNLRDSFIKRTIDKFAPKIDEYKKQLIAEEGAETVARLEKEGRLNDVLKSKFDLEEFKPKGNLRFYPLKEGGVGVSKSVETHLLPKSIVEELNNFSGGKGKDIIDKMFMPFDVFNRNWKPLATAVRPRYHTRNILGNLYNAIVVGGTNPKQFGIALLNQVKDHIGSAIKENSILGKVYKPFFGKNPPSSEIMKLAIDNDVVGRGFFGADLNDLVTAVDKGDDIMKTIKNINTPAEIYKVPVLKQWLMLSQKVGEFIEDNARLSMFQQGLKKFGGDAELAKGFVNKHLFDYLTGLGEADKYIKRLIPFWSWTRFNVPLQLGAIGKTPLRHLALQKGTEPYTQSVELTDEGYQYLSDREKEAGYVKVGTTEKGGKEYDKYVKTASVLPVQDIAKVIGFLKNDEDVGWTPIFDTLDLLASQVGLGSKPTEKKDYFGRPIEQFEGEREKFLGLSVKGRTKELFSKLPILTEINKLVGGGVAKTERPNLNVRIEQVLSPTGTVLVDPEKNKFYYELEKEKELKGSYTAGLESMYKRYIKLDMRNKGGERTYRKNIEILEKILKTKGLNEIDLFKIKRGAISGLIKDMMSGN